MRRMAIVFVDSQDESCAAQAEIKLASRIVWRIISRAFVSEDCRRTTLIEMYFTPLWRIARVIVGMDKGASI